MADITETQLKIKAVVFALESFARFSDEQQRKDLLRAQFDAVQNLDTYFCFSEAELKDALNKLAQENLLLEKENLLLEKENLLLEKEKLLLAQQYGKWFLLLISTDG
jgi:hypothetical protein